MAAKRSIQSIAGKVCQRAA